ncbi:MAG: OmpA family protein [Novosphingobium sp.]|uniref:OmpA family protein n=1 Tax=Novosphingobium sp. TaxID=1874826 RepID=UPI0032BC6AB0
MRNLTMGVILASTALATPALARDDSVYIEIDGGVVFVDALNFDLDHVSNPLGLPVNSRVATLDTKPGYDFGGIIGYDFGGFRLEAEASHRRAGAKSLLVANGAQLYPLADATGNVSTLSFMVNGLFDLGPNDGPQVFAGGGVGYGRTKINAAASPDPSADFAVNGTDSGFAWQLIAGLRYPLGDRIDIGLKYRYFNQDNVFVPATYTFARVVSPDSVGPRAVVGGTAYTDTVNTRMRSHSAMLTLTYNFTGAPPPPVVAEPVPPLPIPVEPPLVGVTPPAPPPCNKGPYIVFFDWDKSEITPEASAVLDSAVVAYGNCASVPIMLAGHADRSGSNAYNEGLSQRRNASVTAYLTQRGIPGGAISSQSFGEGANRVPTADGVKELQNRRVEITYGPGSGM